MATQPLTPAYRINYLAIIERVIAGSIVMTLYQIITRLLHHFGV